MDLVKSSIGITKTIKNVSRVREILTVFGRNGFDEFIIKFNLHTKIPGFVLPQKKRIKSVLDSDEYDEENFWQAVGFRLRKSFEELGPSFIKVGQLLSTREDILHPELINELKMLQNKAAGFDYEIAKKTIESSLGKSIDDVFKKINTKPIGMASIGIAYKGELLDGTEVVIKVRRPEIKTQIMNDFEIIYFLAQQIEKVSNDIKYLGMSRVIEDFFKSIQLELNFLIEGLNGEKLAKNLKEVDKDGLFVIPKIYRDISSESILVMEFLDGQPFNELSALNEGGSELEDKLMKSVSLFIHTLLADGFFHADLHGGNFFLLKDGRIGIIDFGLMGTLSKKNRSNLVAILFALVSNNYENLVFEFLDVAECEKVPNHEVLTRDIQQALMPYMGLSVQETDVTLLINSIVTTLAKHELYLPREWFVIFRALMTLDGVGKSLNIDLNIFEVIDKELPDIMEELFSKDAIMEEAVWLGRDTLNSLRIIPRHIRWFMKKMSKDQYTFDINLKGVKEEITGVSKAISFVGLMFLSCTFIFCGAFFVTNPAQVSHVSQIPVLSWVFWIIGLITFVRAAIFLRF